MNPDHPIEDDRLRLIFTCCHPALALDAQVALTLRLLGGLRTPEIARAFLLPEATLAQRLVRAKRKIRTPGIPYVVPPSERSCPRGSARCCTWSTSCSTRVIRRRAAPRSFGASLPTEAIRLARVAGFADARRGGGARPARAAAAPGLATRRAPVRRAASWCCSPIRIARRWDRSRIDEGLAVLDRAASLGARAAYQLQAAIAAVHAEAATAAETDWPRIVLLYDRLMAVAPSPVVELNRAVAVSMARGPAEALALVDDLAASGDLDDYYLLYSTRGELLRRLGRRAEAALAYERAAALASNSAERQFLEHRRAQLSD